MKRFVILYFDKSVSRNKVFEALLGASSKEQAIESFADSFPDGHIFKVIELPDEQGLNPAPDTELQSAG